MKHLKLYKIFESFEEESGITVELGRSKVVERGTIQNIIVKYNGTPITGENKEPGLGNMNVVIQSEDAYVGDIKIPEEFKGIGLAKHIYQATSDLIGKPIIDSTKRGQEQSERGGYVWKNRTSFQPKKRKEFINESNEIDSNDLDNLIDPIRDDIRDMLVDFVGYGYDIKFIPVNMYSSSLSFQIHIFRKGWPLAGYEDIDPILIDGDILDELVRVCDFIKLEIGFDYRGSYYHYNGHMGFSVDGKDIFKSGGEKFVTSISLFFEN